MALLFVKELEFLSFTIHRNCQLNVRRWRKPESLSPVHHANISCFSDQFCGIQNKSFILQLSMLGVLSNNIELCLQIIHYYLWHVLEVCKCPVHHIENRPKPSYCGTSSTQLARCTTKGLSSQLFIWLWSDTGSFLLLTTLKQKKRITNI